MKKTKFFIAIGFFSLISILVSGCSSGAKNDEAVVQDQTVQAIERVLQQTLNAPDEELLAEYYYLVNSEAASDEREEPETGTLDTLLEERFGDYFTEQGYEKFIDELAFNYSIGAEASEYQLIIDKIDVTQDEDHPHHYTFDVQLICITDDGEEKIVLITGQAESQEKGKLASLEINDDEGIEQEMADKSQEHH
ncbi:MAG: hypothetical protein RR548_02600 [Carnobacterium sp.]|uniref:DUF5104 domain-containing protein n=1 Tax=Carnobacterium antarcticum TaxID=2126436 RepID=A0ABW4NMY5_9LACT|nr:MULTISPECIES: hypothetical protein [unclassified Carnobacterium]ALV22646.1 hypothetical protein NY10_2059 [Carnobacterium sp. CP1]QQP70549.1 hypothetical protein JHE06_01635 [Carnobacterium sp. CS13]